MNPQLQVVVHRSARVASPGADVAVSLSVPSDLGFVGDAVELAARYCDTGVLSPRRLQFNLRTALAEALANAIEYGNRQDPAKRVRVEIACGREAVRIDVADDGAGFDPEGVPDPTAPENLEREAGRGLFVLRHLVDQVEFNERGNRVCLVLRAG
ncbi:MAG TPA: ATP-binding protein [Gemmatimonadales bacterium]|nr:ATP-binding protein [Gemmatimonadales bacterium]